MPKRDQAVKYRNLKYGQIIERPDRDEALEASGAWRLVEVDERAADDAEPQTNERTED